ncbi:MAG: hypothetical protein ACPLY7_02170, partial [Microgenomates group bacterium]
GHLQNPLPSQSNNVAVVAAVGGYSITSLSGWASPFAEVSLSSEGVARKTVADETGFFAFNSISLPDAPKELCLISQDVNQLPSYPLCLPPPPRNQNIEIQDVLLSPTLSLESGKILVGKTAKASGMTVPDSEVEVYLFVEKNYHSYNLYKIYNLFSPSPAEAANFPIYETKSNANGYFEFSLPASAPSNNRLFVTTVFSPTKGIPSVPNHQSLITNYSSPKSNTLSFQVLGLWGLLKLFLQSFFLQVRSFSSLNLRDPLFIIMIEIIILFGLLAAVLAKKGREKSKEVKRDLI